MTESWKAGKLESRRRCDRKDEYNNSTNNDGIGIGVNNTVH